MATDSTHSSVISRDNSGFPPYLDFDTLRAASIDYLSSLTGKIWTDYNVHDPGITILEMLIYAVLDLGYRTNLPAADIFTRNPNDTGADNNFFTPASILTCNPLTITDYRKLLIDITGVRNAWLEVAEDVNAGAICQNGPILTNAPLEKLSAADLIVVPPFINGLYHVYLELEDPLAPGQQDQIVLQVKQALLAHRNLCEDFIDISILCPLDICISADIVLDANADASTVYGNVVNALQAFFSPAPRFYTLKQLLDKGKPIEDIFAGRPYDVSSSHGFVDTAEFESIIRRKEIHLSDVYAIIMGIAGVRSVRQLKLKMGTLGFSASWQFVVPPGYVTQLSVDKSSFTFIANGRPIPVQLPKSSSVPGQVINVLQPAENLDLAIPSGIYHTDLADYYSIQHEFPLVYGIGDGGLPDSAPVKRKAQALQLKGYLLFFDQLLADYLTQLSNIRSLFAMSDTGLPQTYFSNQLTNVPGFDDLLLYHNTDASSAGSTLAWPVSGKDFRTLMQKGSISNAQIRQLQDNYAIATKNGLKTSLAAWQNDFNNGLFTLQNAATTENAAFFYITGSDDDSILTSALFSTADDAAASITLLPVVASAAASYSEYFTHGQYSFNIRLSLPAYMDYLQKITEDRYAFRTRRGAFLDHLLSRFAEQFTDFALLSHDLMKSDALTDAVIENKESFLTRYPALSSQRGKAFNYRAQDTVSGFEDRFSAYAGISNPPGATLCNFEVAAYEDTYSVKLELAGFHLMDAPGRRFEGLQKAQTALSDIFSSLSDPEKYKISDVVHEQKYQLQVRYKEGFASYPVLLQDEDEAGIVKRNLLTMFNPTLHENILVSGVEFRLQLKDQAGLVIRRSAARYPNPDDAFAAAIALLKIPADAEKWEITDAANNPSGRFSINNKKKPERLIDMSAFKIDVNNAIVGKPGKYNFDLLDKDHMFKFRSLGEFDSEKQAKSECYRILMLMADLNNYKIDKEGKRTRLQIISSGKPVAECVNKLDAGKVQEFKDRTCEKVRSHYYTLAADDFPCRWKFSFQLGFEKGLTLLFLSDAEFDSEDKARTAALAFDNALPGVTLDTDNAKYVLNDNTGTAGRLTCTHADAGIVEEDNGTKLQQAKNFLELRKQIQQRLLSKDPAPFETGIVIDELSRSGAYVYRLVDKDRRLAMHTPEIQTPPADQINALYERALAGYPILEICLGGDNTEIDPTSGQYRYCIRCHNNFAPFATDTILFKSIALYADAATAAAAFDALYLSILQKAADPANYGDGKYVLPTLPAITKPDSRSVSVVFVADETAQIADLAAAAKSYPIRLSDSTVRNSPPGYYFSIFAKDATTPDWTSVKTYADRTEARKDFYCFMLLLLYKGNYTFQTDPCGVSAIFIREVLAESTARFPDPEAAWGRDGIQHFIDVAQKDGAFHAAIDKDSCYASDFIADHGINAIHPCSYNTPAARDSVLEKLFSSFKSLPLDKLYKFVNDGSHNLLYGVDGNPFAVLDTSTQGADPCANILDLLRLALDEKNYTLINGRPVLGTKDASGNFIQLAEPYDPSLLLPAWRQQWLSLDFFFPVRVNKEAKYCVEVRLPGFNTPDTLGGLTGCGCHDSFTPNDDACYLAWRIPVCYDSCAAAMNGFTALTTLLADYSLYKPYFDCPCQSFGISLHKDADIIAVNPQSYPTPDDVCDAIARSKRLINSEGLRVVEHILLRPRTAGDCACQYLGKRNYQNPTQCNELSWTEEAFVRGIDKVREIAFVPGSDPFSFIATVVLPAWPERFCTKENRQILENILYREAPAHILLRILWLPPEETCQFESLNRNWKAWLLQKDGCPILSPDCTFLDFLFGTELAPEDMTLTEKQWLENINAVYNWHSTKL